MPSGKLRVRKVWWEHAAPLFIYSALSLAYTWPLARDFTTRIIGIVPADARKGIWLIWHFKEWVLGRDSLFYTQTLYYPAGISTLVDGVGPLSGFFALPFWHWGPIAAYNGAILIGFCLTGYCMYLCARGLGLTSGLAIVSGVIYQLFPMHIASIEGHLEKAFLGLMPLAVLATIRALDPKRHWVWIPITGLFLLGTLLYTASQFVFCLFAVVLIVLGVLWAAPERQVILRRLLFLVGAVALIVGPLLFAVARVSRNPLMLVDLKGSSIMFEPDLAQFVVPSPYSAALGGLFYRPDRPLDWCFPSKVAWLQRSDTWFGSGIDTCVTVPLAVLVLCAIAIAKGGKMGRAWVGFAVPFVVLSLGPALRAFGKIRYGMTKPFVMPYGVLTTRVPGLGFMRTPGRFMMIGAVGMAIASTIGLQYLRKLHPGWRQMILLIFLALLLVETWPRTWSQMDLPATSKFYDQVAKDRDDYAILDLPVEWPSIYLGSILQCDQLTHRKPIAWGYLSRSYKEHPVRAVKDLMDGTATGPELQRELMEAGYKYVIWHKAPKVLAADERWILPLFEDQQPLESLFGDQRPEFEDGLIRVYVLRPPAAASR